MGYYLIAFLFIARKRAPPLALVGALAGSAIGLIRIAQGAHFLTDVIFAGFVTVTLVSFLMLRPNEESESIFTTNVVSVVAEGLALK